MRQTRKNPDGSLYREITVYLTVEVDDEVSKLAAVAGTTPTRLLSWVCAAAESIILEAHETAPGVIESSRLLNNVNMYCPKKLAPRPVSARAELRAAKAAKLAKIAKLEELIAEIKRDA